MYTDFWQLPSGPCRSGSELPRIVSRSVLKALVILDGSICHKPCSPKFQGPSELYVYHEIRVLTDGCVISIQMNKPPLLVQSIMPWVASDFRPVYRAAVGQIQYVFWIYDAFKTVANSQACPLWCSKSVHSKRRNAHHGTPFRYHCPPNAGIRYVECFGDDGLGGCRLTQSRLTQGGKGKIADVHSFVI